METWQKYTRNTAKDGNKCTNPGAQAYLPGGLRTRPEDGKARQPHAAKIRACNSVTCTSQSQCDEHFIEQFVLKNKVTGG